VDKIFQVKMYARVVDFNIIILVQFCLISISFYLFNGRLMASTYYVCLVSKLNNHHETC